MKGLLLALMLAAGTTPAIADPADWAGFYAGVHGSALVRGTVHAPATNYTGILTGHSAGAFFGHGWEVGGTIIRIEGEANWSNLLFSGIGADASMDGFAAITGRVGVPVGAFMPYFGAGVAGGQARLSGPFPSPYNVTAAHTGLVFAGGVEVAIGPLLVRGEIAQLHLFDANYPTPSSTSTLRYNTTFARGGIGVRF